MASRQLDEERIFHVARDILNPDTRFEYLDQVCAGDQALRDRVVALLKAHEKAEEFLQSGQPEPAPTIEATSLTERPGSTIGRYRLMEQVGEGGMGTVFVAEQERPIRRKVAIKVIKPGMDSKAVIARFEAERQALALMDHPSIAKVLDAGSTASGRPYFVMELVRGMPITDYCDQKILPIRERLDLFVQVCQAIQHAHQKGIIHRDIKPTNVLVTEHDGKAVPKVIDFGVSKALGQRLTERTIYTALQAVVGTPLYMSPEQAALSAVDVDTRSDVYSLGVLLYELLTGTTPLDKKQIEQAACDEVWRMVREHEPSKPSTKVSTLGQSAASVSACRQTVPERLAIFLRGDLDWIVMKALEKDRARRYETASSFAVDVENYLGNKPVNACPPSAMYRLRKFAYRNRVAVVTSALVLTSLVLGIIATACMAVVAVGQARSATQANKKLEREIETKQQMIYKLAEAYYGDAVTAVLSGDNERGNRAIDLARQTVGSAYRLAVLEGLTALNNGQPLLAVPHAIAARDGEPPAEDPDRVGARALFATACVWAGYDDLAVPELYLLRGLEAHNDTDLLLKAYAFGIMDARESWRLLQDSPRIQSSPMGLWIRANSDAWEAIETGDPELTEQVLQECEYVDFLFRDHPFALNMHAQAFVGAIERSQTQTEREHFAERGRQLVEKFDKYPDSVWGDWPRWLFYRAVGDDPKAAAAIRRVGRDPTTYCWFFAADCLYRQDVRAALKEFTQAIAPEHRTDKYVRVAESRLVSNLEDSADLVRKLAEDLLDDPSPLIRRNALYSLCMACPEEMRQNAARAASVRSPVSEAGFDPFGEEAMVKYLAGQLSEDELLEKAASHRYFLANAQFTIGMVYLATGRQLEAREHLEKAVTPRAFESFDYAWAKAYLALLDKGWTPPRGRGK